ncbi:MAG: flagellar basal body-associated protein FliL [Flavobacterium sp.]|jgi:flagellar basal body-associated protein FliL
MINQLNNNVFLIWTFIVLLILSPNVMAEDEARAAVYVKLTKGMAVNYGQPSLSRLKYMKIAVQVRLQNVVEAEAIEHHLPALLDSLITLFSSSEESLVNSTGGREEIRKRALETVQRVMKREEGQSIVQDLLFGSFIIQR